MIFILHGFATSNPSNKFKIIKNYFKDETVIGLNYDFDPIIAHEQLTKQIEDAISDNNDTEVIFIGSSLGGLLAQYYAKLYFGKAIILNPCIEPEKTLIRYVGENINYTTGKPFTFTKKQVIGFSKFLITPGEVDTLLLLDTGDDVIDPIKTFNRFENHALIKTFENGSHRFDHLNESLVVIEKFINTLN